MLTQKQLAYCRHRAEGLGQERAALEAGYSRRSCAVTASRMERDPAIRRAIEAARSGEVQQFPDAEAYLHAVATGAAVPDPVRVAAARALLPYTRARERAPLGSKTPRQLDARAGLDAEAELLEAWADKARRVRAKLARG